MAIKPILFNTEMVRAILDGRKTCTRRVIKPQPQSRLCYTYAGSHKSCIGKWTYPNRGAHRYEATADIRFRAGGDDVRLQFANGNTDSINRLDYDTFVHKWFSHYGEWKQSLFMPKEAARIWLKVTDVRVERLQDMTDDDAEAEGCFDYTSTALGFFDVWDSTIKKSDLDRYGWNANPWVWVIKFERCEKPERV